MKIALPSRGLLGCSEVDMDIPRYRHLREIVQVDYPVEQVGYEFVKSLISDPSVLSQITFQDKDYLLTIAVASMHLNSIPFRVTCACGKPVNAVYNYGEQDLYSLPDDASVVTEKMVDEAVYRYHILSAEDEYRIVRWAQEKSDGDEAKYKSLYEEGFICKTFGYDLTDENLRIVSDYPTLAYYSALMFREMVFHGCTPTLTVKCPHCGQDITVYVPFAQSLLTWTSADIVNEFMTISKLCGFDSFLQLSFAELAQMRANIESMDK